ncbi:phosphodiesterase [Flavimaricola marinus]|uniref:3',5'-cyclic adenosine monophosphate phosphodiesterase CpdA n=1 Tax=Flavimaricola marinus TaxID=1819565 RepID=A0A238LFS1_9RHOB|nr:phosphodiesterase [Flavimaricola marinus]SMY08433.1 3',5'-cyclic adenosine monophosphate phosphodiesterase CpdA [Flavimaricola marinus]
MSRVVVLTDLHIRAEPEPGKPDADARLLSAIDHINRYQSDADLVIVTGDLAHSGERAAYDKLASHLTRLALPHVLMLGNHDNRAAFLDAFPQISPDENGHVQQVVDLPEARLICLDTLNGPPYSYPFSHLGVLCAERLAWLDAALSGTDRPCILFMHHPAHKTGFAAMDAIMLMHGPAFYDRILAHGNVAHIVCGHVHRTISGSHRGVPFSIFKSLVGQMPMLFDLMDFHMETDEPPAYGLLMISDDGVVAHSEDFGLTDLDALRAASPQNASSQPK